MSCRFLFMDKNNEGKQGKEKTTAIHKKAAFSPLEITTDVMEFDLFY